MTTQPILCAIDAQISPGVAGGTETHILLQLSSLAGLTGERFLVMGRKDHTDELRPFIGPNMELVEYPEPYAWFRPGQRDRFSPGPVWSRLLAPSGHARHRTPGENDAWLKGRGARLVHFPYPQHFQTRLPFVYEPWGLPHRSLPEAYPADERRWMDALFRDGCEKAALIVTATRWAKDDLVRAYGLSPSKVAVLPRAVPLEPPGGASPDDALGDLPSDFALYPAITWPSKNHVNLLRGIARLRDDHGIRLNLVCTGRTKKPEFTRILEEIQRLGLKKQVRFLGSVSRARLSAIFRAARFLVHPSKFEGLGLPLLEAFSVGLPVIAARATCIPEVVGDAALLFDPDSPEAICAALKRAMEEPRLLSELSAKGARRLEEQFPSGEALADRYAAIYRTAARIPLSRQDQALMEEMLS